MENIEVEIKTLLTKEQYQQFLAFFSKKGELLDEDDQITYYFDGDKDLRIQQNNSYSKIVLKEGAMNAQQRDETEILCDRDYFEELEHLFTALGYEIKIKWFRHRHSFAWQGITVTVDDTQHFGYMIELEIMSTPENKDTALATLKKKMQVLGLQENPELLQRKHEEYVKHWKEFEFKEVVDE